MGNLEMKAYEILLDAGAYQKLVAKTIARNLIELMFQWD